MDRLKKNSNEDILKKFSLQRELFTCIRKRHSICDHQEKRKTGTDLRANSRERGGLVS